MQIFEKKDDASYRRTPKCGYCRQEGHNQYQCDEVGRHWEYWKTHTVPPTSIGYHYSRRNPRYWGEWYEKCSVIYHEQQMRKKKILKRPVTRAASKCGFCREAGHNRRDCYHMNDFLEKCFKANENWRRAAYKHLVEEKGISVGACIQVKKKKGWGANADIETAIAIITDINFASLSVMTAGRFGSDYGNPYHSPLEVKAMVGDDEVILQFARTGDYSYQEKWRMSLSTLDSYIIRSIKSRGYYSGQWFFDKLMSRADYPLDEKWITDYKGAFKFLTKKRSKKQLENDGIIRHIDEWAKKD